MQVSEGSDTFEFRSPHGMKAAHSRLRSFAGKRFVTCSISTTQAVPGTICRVRRTLSQLRSRR